MKIIDNKKIDMTEDEFVLYKQICRSYDRPNFKGEELFKDLFETDDNGLIVFLKPPSARHISMEVFLFVVIVMHHQNLRITLKKSEQQILTMQNKFDEQMKDMKNKFDELCLSFSDKKNKNK